MEALEEAAEHDVLEAMEAARIIALIKQLKPQQRLVLRLRAEGCSYKEICALTGRTYTWVIWSWPLLFRYREPASADDMSPTTGLGVAPTLAYHITRWPLLGLSGQSISPSSPAPTHVVFRSRRRYCLLRPT